MSWLCIFKVLSVRIGQGQLKSKIGTEVELTDSTQKLTYFHSFQVIFWSAKIPLALPEKLLWNWECVYDAAFLIFETLSSGLEAIESCQDFTPRNDWCQYGRKLRLDALPNKLPRKNWIQLCSASQWKTQVTFYVLTHGCIPTGQEKQLSWAYTVTSTLFAKSCHELISAQDTCGSAHENSWL